MTVLNDPSRPGQVEAMITLDAKRPAVLKTANRLFVNVGIPQLTPALGDRLAVATDEHCSLGPQCGIVDDQGGRTARWARSDDEEELRESVDKVADVAESVLR